MSTNSSAQNLLAPYPNPPDPRQGPVGHEPGPHELADHGQVGYPDSVHGTQNLPLAPVEPGADAWFPTGGQSDEG